MSQGQRRRRTDGESRDQTLDDVLDRLDELEEKNQELRRENGRLRDDVDELKEKVETLERRNRDYRSQLDRLRERDAELDDRIDDVEESADKARQVAKDLAGQVNQLRQRLEHGDLAEHTGTDSEKIETETALEDIVSLPDNIADQELSPNQRRARFLAGNITDFAQPTGGGTFAIMSSRAAKILKENTDCAGKHETVKRVFEWLERLDEESISVTTRSGSKALAIDKKAARRLSEIGDLETHVTVSSATN